MRLVDGRALRLIGVNALETGKHGAADEPFAADAARRLGELLRQGPVSGEPGAEPYDRHGRTLADLYASDGGLIAATLAAEGLALATAVPPNTARIECVVAAERAARQARRGLWAEPSAWSIAAAGAPADLRGFKHVTGKVTERTTRRAGTALLLDGRLELWFPADAPAAAALLARATPGATLAVRGWWGSYRGRPSLRIAHPAMLEVLD